MKHTVITIGREYGSGGRGIAQKIAEKLSVPFYDKKIIELAAKETGLSEDYIRRAEEYKTNSFLYSLYFSMENLPLSDRIFMAESQIIKKVASEGSCVIVGRCADYVLREHKNCINVFIHAPLDDRIRRVKDEYKIDTYDVRSHILKKDKARASYYNYFTTSQWGKYQNYDLSVNSSLGTNAVVMAAEQLVVCRGDSL